MNIGSVTTARAKVLALAASFLIVSVGELLWHRFVATSRSQLGQTIFFLYTSRDAKSGKGLYPWFDSIAPAVLLGLAVGWIGRGWRRREMAWCVLLASANIVILQEVYPQLFSNGALWWASSGSSLDVGVLLFNIVESTVVVSFFALVGRFGLQKA